MKMSDIKQEEFENVVRPVIEWLNNNCHPHVTVIIDPTRAELLEGVVNHITYDFIKD